MPAQPDDFGILARQALAAAVGSPRTLPALVAGLGDVSGRLLRELAPVLGSLGVRAIMSRALKLATARRPYLSRVAVFEEGYEATSVLREKGDGAFEEVRDAFEDLLVTFLGILAGLVGRGLAGRLAAEALAGPGSAGPESSDPSAPSNGGREDEEGSR